MFISKDPEQYQSTIDAVTQVADDDQLECWQEVTACMEIHSAASFMSNLSWKVRPL